MTLAVTAMAGGTGNPDVGPLLAAIKGDDRIVLISPWSDAVNVAKIESDFADRFGPMRQQESHCFIGVSGSFATLVTYGTARNSPHISVIPREGNMVSPWRLAASLLLCVRCVARAIRHGLTSAWCYQAFRHRQRLIALTSLRVTIC
jgi:phage tail sheath gpL-like